MSEEALNVLESMTSAERNAKWYYYSAIINYNLGDVDTAEYHIDIACNNIYQAKIHIEKTTQNTYSFTGSQSTQSGFNVYYKNNNDYTSIYLRANHTGLFTTNVTFIQVSPEAIPIDYSLTRLRTEVDNQVNLNRDMTTDATGMIALTI